MTAKDCSEVGGFPSTRWSLIFSAHDQDSVPRREALGELLRLYLPALRAHLLYRRNIQRQRTEDFLQGFVADQILQRDLLSKADAARGRFRSFLLRSLETMSSANVSARPGGAKSLLSWNLPRERPPTFSRSSGHASFSGSRSAACARSVKTRVGMPSGAFSSAG